MSARGLGREVHLVKLGAVRGRDQVQKGSKEARSPLAKARVHRGQFDTVDVRKAQLDGTKGCVKAARLESWQEHCVSDRYCGIAACSCMCHGEHHRQTCR